MRYHEAMKNAVKLGLVLACVLLVVFPAAAKKKKTKAKFRNGDELPEVVWPSPPQEPVIRFLGSYWGDINFPPSKKGRFKRKLLGEKPPNRRLHRPFDVAADSERQRIYVSDYNYIGVFDVANKEYIQLTGRPPFVLQYVTGLTVDGAGNLYAVDAKAKRVAVFNPDFAPIKAYGGSDSFQHPVDVGVNDELGRVYVSDNKANTVHVFSKEEGKLLFSFGSLGTEEGQFYKPSHLWVDREGLVYVTDFFNFRVQAFDADGEFLFKIGSIGTNPGQFSKPKGVAVDSEGHIYVVDSAFGNVQVFDRSGQILMAFSNHGWNDGEMRLPAGIFIDKKDRIYVADSINSRVCAFDFLGAPETMIAPVEEEPQREAAPEPATESIKKTKSKKKKKKSRAPAPEPSSEPGAALPFAHTGEARAQLLEGRYARAARTWKEDLAGVPSSRYTIQIAIFCEESSVKRSLEESKESPSLYITPAGMRKRTCYRTCWGVYADRSGAERAYAQLPPYFTGFRNKPKIVRLSSLK